MVLFQAAKLTGSVICAQASSRVQMPWTICGRSVLYQASYFLQLAQEFFTAISEKEISDGESITLELYNDTKARIIKNKLPAQTRKFKHVAEFAVQQMKNELNDGYGKQA